MSRPDFTCSDCNEPLGRIRPAKGSGDYLDVTNALVIVWWDGGARQHVIACPCGEWSYWIGEVKWRPIAA